MTEPGGVRVSGLVPDPRHPGAVRVQVGGRALLTVPATVVAAHAVKVGSELDPVTHAALCRAADTEGSYRAALECLARRPYAARDLTRRLVTRGHPPEAAEQAVERAIAAGLVNDETFARNFVQTRSARGRGPARLRRELSAMGVAPRLVDQVLAEELTDVANQDAVRRLAARRAAQLRDVPRPDRLRRVVAYLARRGYAGREVREAVRRTIGD